VTWRLFGPVIVFAAFIEPAMVVVTVVVDVVNIAVTMVVVVVDVVVTVVVVGVDDELAVVVSHPVTSIFRKCSKTVYTVLISKENNLLVSLMVCCVYEFKPLGHWFNSPLLQY
jgi:hypothetical protein